MIMKMSWVSNNSQGERRLFYYGGARGFAVVVEFNPGPMGPSRKRGSCISRLTLWGPHEVIPDLTEETLLLKKF